MCDEQLRRIKQLEIALAHQESVVQDLSSQLIQQWQNIDTINRRLVKIDEKIEEQTHERFGSRTQPNQSRQKPKVRVRGRD